MDSVDVEWHRLACIGKSCSYPGWEGTILGGSRLPFYRDVFLEAFRWGTILGGSRLLFYRASYFQDFNVGPSLGGSRRPLFYSEAAYQLITLALSKPHFTKFYVVPKTTYSPFP